MVAVEGVGKGESGHSGARKGSASSSGNTCGEWLRAAMRECVFLCGGARARVTREDTSWGFGPLLVLRLLSVSLCFVLRVDARLRVVPPLAHSG